MQQSLAFFVLVLQKNFAAFCTQKLQNFGLTQGLLYFIIYIGKHSGCAAGDITKDLHMDWGHTQRSIDKLVGAGFVHKEKNEKDKRAYDLSLTPKGQQAYSASHQLFFEWDTNILETLSTDEKEQLFNILEKLHKQTGGYTYVQNNQQPD